MKTFGIIMKILVAVAAIAGIVYVIATYGDKIVEWAKKLLGRDCKCTCEEDFEDCDCDCCCQAEATEDEVEETDFEG